MLLNEFKFFFIRYGFLKNVIYKYEKYEKKMFCIFIFFLFKKVKCVIEFIGYKYSFNKNCYFQMKF